MWSIGTSMVSHAKSARNFPDATTVTYHFTIRINRHSGHLHHLGPLWPRHQVPCHSAGLATVCVTSYVWSGNLHMDNLCSLVLWWEGENPFNYIRKTMFWGILRHLWSSVVSCTALYSGPKIAIDQLFLIAYFKLSAALHRRHRTP
jgi:hypothetical protein